MNYYRECASCFVANTTCESWAGFNSSSLLCTCH